MKKKKREERESEKGRIVKGVEEMWRERERGNVKGKAGMKRGRKKEEAEWEADKGGVGKEGNSHPYRFLKKLKVGVYGKIVRDL